jgi:hypothetical protein
VHSDFETGLAKKKEKKAEASMFSAAVSYEFISKLL